jgi:hypothetical protein
LDSGQREVRLGVVGFRARREADAAVQKAPRAGRPAGHATGLPCSCEVRWTHAGEGARVADRVVRALLADDGEAGRRSSERRATFQPFYRLVGGGRANTRVVATRPARARTRANESQRESGRATHSSSTMQASRTAEPTERKRLWAWKRNWSLNAGSLLARAGGTRRVGARGTVSM